MKIENQSNESTANICDSSDMIEFDIMKLVERYENVREQSWGKTIGSKITYWIQDKIGNDIGSISLGRELLIYVDNFPRQKLYYRSDIPINTWEELEYDAKRCGLQLICK